MEWISGFFTGLMFSFLLRFGIEQSLKWLDKKIKDREYKKQQRNNVIPFRRRKR